MKKYNSPTIVIKSYELQCVIRTSAVFTLNDGWASDIFFSETTETTEE